MNATKPGDFIRLTGPATDGGSRLVMQLGQVETCPSGIETAICVPVENRDMFQLCDKDLLLLDPLSPIKDSWIILLFANLHPLPVAAFQAKEGSLGQEARKLIRLFWKFAVGAGPAPEEDCVPHRIAWDTGSPLWHEGDVRHRFQLKHAYNLREEWRQADQALNHKYSAQLMKAVESGAVPQQATLVRLADYLSAHEEEISLAAAADEQLQAEDYVRFAGSSRDPWINACLALLSGDTDLTRQFVSVLEHGSN